jgi:Putative phage serine protease XkdF
MTTTHIEGKILKTDDDQRIVYGWASVISESGVPTVDTQGDVIDGDTLHKAANEFMEAVRVGKVMHFGEKKADIIHSLVLTEELAKALGLQSDREGWIIGMKVHDDEAWGLVKSGVLKAFSIGGRAKREEIK